MQADTQVSLGITRASGSMRRRQTGLTRSRRAVIRPNALELHRLGTIVAFLLRALSQLCAPASHYEIRLWTVVDLADKRL